jgi:23S rRNA (guanosine2251-2'-O)-methyltransferase
MANSQIFFGRNPLVEALRAQLPVEEIFCEGPRDQQWAREIASEFMDSSAKIPMRSILPNPPKGIRSQGIAFRVAHDFYCNPEDIDWEEETRVLFCNHLEDVQNLGALARSAAAFGFGIIVHERQRSVSMNEQALRISMGLAFRIRFLQVSNLLPLLLSLHKKDFELVGLDAAGEQTIYDWEPQTGRIALVLGSESQGISRPIQKKLDLSLNIPMEEGVDSLNVSQAGAIAMSRLYARGIQGE